MDKYARHTRPEDHTRLAVIYFNGLKTKACIFVQLLQHAINTIFFHKIIKKSMLQTKNRLKHFLRKTISRLLANKICTNMHCTFPTLKIQLLFTISIRIVAKWQSCDGDLLGISPVFPLFSPFLSKILQPNLASSS